MSFLKKGEIHPEHAGVMFAPAPKVERKVDNNPDKTPDAKQFEGVQTGVKINTSLPEDPLKGIAKAGNMDFHAGTYVDSSGTSYFVAAVADGHVLFCRIDGGHPTQMRVLPVSEFALKRYRPVVP